MRGRRSHHRSHQRHVALSKPLCRVAIEEVRHERHVAYELSMLTHIKYNINLHLCVLCFSEYRHRLSAIQHQAGLGHPVLYQTEHRLHQGASPGFSGHIESAHDPAERQIRVLDRAKDCASDTFQHRRQSSPAANDYRERVDKVPLHCLQAIRA